MSTALVATIATVGGLVVATAAPAQADVLSAGGDFVAFPNTLTIGDTRSGVGFTKGVAMSGTANDLTVSLPNVTMTTVSAILVSVTVINPTASGYLQVAPGGGSANGTSQVNFTNGASTTSNTVAVAVPASRKVTFTLGGGANADLLVNAEGYYTVATDPNSRSGGLKALDHVRLFDTRTGTGGVPKARVKGGGGLLTVDFSSLVPAGAPSAYLDLIVVGAASPGYIRVRADGQGWTQPSRVNFGPGDTAQGIAVPLSAAGKAVFEVNGIPNTSLVDLVGTLEGYTSASPTAGGGFRAVQARLVGGANLGAGASVDIQVGGRNGLPLNGIEAAALNFTVAGATNSSAITAYPTGAANPGTSLANYQAGQVVSDFAVLKTGTDGKITVVNRGTASVSLFVDIEGWFDVKTATAPVRAWSPTAAIQLAQDPTTTNTKRPVVFSWVDENGELQIAQQDDMTNIGSIKTVTVHGDQPVRGPVSLGLNGTTLQASVQGKNTDALVKNGPLLSTEIQRWNDIPYTDLGGSMASAPVIATLPDGSLTLFAIDASGALWLFDEAAAYPAWTRVPAAPVLTNSLTVLTTTRGVQLAAVTPDKTVVTALYAGGVVSSWITVGGTAVVDRPAIIAETSGNVRIAMRQGNKILTKAQTSATTFGGWQTLNPPVGTTIQGAPAGVRDPNNGRDALIVRATTNTQSQTAANLYAAYETGQSTGVFGGWSQIELTDSIGTDPTVFQYRLNDTSTYGIVSRRYPSNVLVVSPVQQQQ